MIALRKAYGLDLVILPLALLSSLLLGGAPVTAEHAPAAVLTGEAGDRWAPLPTIGAPSPRSGHTAVWTGQEMLVWGGGSEVQLVNDGAAFNPATDTWRSLPVDGAPSPRYGYRAAWTGTDLFVWGGADERGRALGDGAAYDPATNTWRPLPSAGAPSPRLGATVVWTGSEVLVWGGVGCPGAEDPCGDGARFDPAANAWAPITSEGAPSARAGATAVWTGSEVLVWGGLGCPRRDDACGDGARFDPAADAWTPMTTEGAPDARAVYEAVWTGSEMLVWAGRGHGARFDPIADAWTPIASEGAPNIWDTPRLVWTGSERLVWGGYVVNAPSSTGARYDPTTDTWSSLPVVGAPAPRGVHSAILTGQELLVWGGSNRTGFLGDGGRYRPPAPSTPDDEPPVPETGYPLDDDAI